MRPDSQPADDVAGSPPRGAANPPRAGALSALHRPATRGELEFLSVNELSTELLARFHHGHSFTASSDSLLLAEQLSRELARAADSHLNRFAPQRYRDLLVPIFDAIGRDGLRNAVVVDAGCGSVNPFTFAFLLLLLGARRAYAIDPEPLQDPTIATQALARAATWMLFDQLGLDALTGPVAPVLVERLHGFDLAQLARGDLTGIDADRLRYRVETLDNLSVDRHEADLVFSVSLLEHIADLDTAIASLYRATKPGGRGIHVVDFADHRIYGGQITDPYAFLMEDSAEPLVHGSNRLRCAEICERFERHGFAVERVERWQHAVAFTEAHRSRLSARWRTMPVDDVATIGARIFVHAVP